MWGILHMRVTSLVAVVAPRTGKIVKNGLHVFESEENLLQNGLLHFVFKIQSNVRNREKPTFLERGLALKNLKGLTTYY